ncbi:S41 family peptidase [Haloimpatiens sp. FM7330]|uniref:S41 family peptidase n=1 Tax=Haloimpatiens sp. FM7330 TaxID=3298610 RepID=UPI003630062C
MKKYKKIALSCGIILAVVLLSVYIYGYIRSQRAHIPNNKKVIRPKFKTQILLNKEMTPQQMKEDIDYLVNTLKNVHPKTYNGFDKSQQNIIKNAYKKVKTSMKAENFYFVANEIICSFKDAHTSLNMDINKKDRIIYMPLIWLHDGLYIKKDTDKLKKGDEVISIGGKRISDLLDKLWKVIPAENSQWVKVIGSNNLIKEPYLRYLKVVKNNYVDIKIERKGKKLSVSLPLVDSKDIVKNQKYTTEDWVSYSLDKENSLGVFKLNICKNDNHYKEALNNFFETISENKIENIAVDLRNNTGGNSSVVDEFMHYLDVDSYMSFGSYVRYSKEAAKQRGYRIETGYDSYKNKEIKNKKVKNNNLIFKGNVYVITSPKTFSSANWFTLIFKDNNIGKIIGEPTGNQPSCYGDILTFQLPNSGFRFNVSYKKFTRPNIKNDPENCVKPDIMVYTKIEDILNNEDAQVDKLIQILKNN